MSTLKDAIRRARAKRNPTLGGVEDIKAFMGDAAAARAEELFNELMDEMRTMGMEELRQIASTIKKGDKGDSIKGDKGAPGKSIIGKQGIPGKPGKNGVGVKGDKGDPGKNGNEIKTADLLKKINEAQNGIKITSVNGLDAFLKNLQRAIREKVKSGGGKKHGGGMTLVAGSNVTLTRNTDGTWTVTATSGGGSAIDTEQLAATASGSNVTLDLTGLSHTSTGVKFVTRNGQVLMPNGNASLPGSSWSQVTTTVTVYNADPSDIYLVQYAHA